MLVLNVHSILETDRRTKFSNTILTCSIYEILCLSETWLTESVTNKALFLDNFEIYRTNRPSHHGCPNHGGVLIAVSRNTPSCRVATNLSNCVIVRILSHLPVLMSRIYSAPHDSPFCWTSEQFLDWLRTMWRSLHEQKAHNVFILGDNNFSLPDWPSLSSPSIKEQIVLDELCKNNFEQLITTATGKSRNILLSNQPQTVIYSAINSLFKSMIWSDNIWSTLCS